MRNLVLSLALAVLVLGSVPGAMAATATGQLAAAPPQGYLLVEEDVVVVLVNEAHQSFLRASENFAKGKRRGEDALVETGS